MQLSLLIMLCTLAIGPWASANESDENRSIDSADGIPYDRMVEKLNTQTRTRIPAPVTHDYLDDAKIHLGVALANSIYSLEIPRNSSLTMSQTGFEVSLGLDLFSPTWAVEFAFLNYGQSGQQRINALQSVQVTASEFDLRFYFHNPVTRTWGYRLGSGLGSRNFHLDYSQPANGSPEFTVPVAIFFGGAEAYLGEQVTIGAEAGLRTALIQDTPERTSLDLLLRVNGKF